MSIDGDPCIHKTAALIYLETGGNVTILVEKKTLS